MTAPSNYSASDIKVLEGLEPVRKRPGMYIGATDSRGLHHLVKEIMDNAVDEAIAGYGKRIQIYLMKSTFEDAPMSITVVDNGRGIPTDMHPSGVSALEVVLTKLHAGGKFEETAYQASGGLHGVGSSAVNALSILLQVVVKRKTKYYFQQYSIGVPKAPVKEIKESEVVKLFPKQSKEFITYETGTLLSFVPDASIFSTTKYQHDTICELIQDRAYLMAGLYFTFYDEFDDIEKHFYFEGGIKALVGHSNQYKKILHSVIYMSGDWTGEKYKIGVEVAMQYNDSFSENLQSYANVIKTPDGGTHLTGFRMALNKVLKDYATKYSLLKDKETFTTEDLREGLTGVVFIKMSSNDIQFESQTKSKLNNIEAQSAVYQIVKDQMEAYLEQHPKAGRAIIDKIMLAARARLAARAAKDAVIRKGALEGSSLPGKLADCQSKDPAESEIYIVEGDSAGGCFSRDTRVALADGRNLSFKDLVAEQEAGKENFCYTIRKDGTIGLEKILNARITKKNAQVIKVILDNAEEITCTPDHKFMLRDGSYKEAKDLSIEDSLMPLYKKLSDKEEFIWQPNKDNWNLLNLVKQTISEVIYPSAFEVVRNYNHKIVSIEKVKALIDVYDIEVPHSHNFALASGVFVHNSAKQGRDRRFQAIFPLRGKILNTERARLDKIIAFEELKNLVIAMGAGVGETFNPAKLRYHRIILMNDADVDGEHITTLALTFFFRHLPEIVRQGYLYIAMPPLFKLNFGKVEEYVYSDEERVAFINKIPLRDRDKVRAQRYKGLGEMNPEQLWSTTMNPITRVLKKVTIVDAVIADQVFDILMGSEVPPRKKFIQSRAKMANLDV